MRDEDLRADRQFEFTQLDIEMSFATQDDVLGVAERAIAAAFQAGIGVELPLPLPRLKYADMMRDYGSDKPDLRCELKLGDLTALARSCGFNRFKKAAREGGLVKGLAAPGWAARSRGEIDKLGEECKQLGAGGLAWMKYNGGKLESNIVKMFTAGEQAEIVKILGAEEGALLLFQAGAAETVNKVLAFLRERVATENGLKKPGEFRAFYVVDFPAFAYAAEQERWVSEHHPFTGIVEQDLPLLRSGNPGDLARVRSTSYDLVINGYECGSGSIRIHDSAVQEKVFQTLNLSEEDIRRRFGFFVDALQYGTPPHAGIAPGIDRTIMVMLGLDSIRDTIAFPKSQRGTDLMSGAPDTVDPRQLGELGIRVEESNA
jgi:aspartyl-tRNA synthetase